MKKIIFLLFLVLLLRTSSLIAQCLPDGITFTTQSQINNFQTNYPGCTDILGDVTIDESYSGAILNLSGLSILNSIGGSLRIFSIRNLTDLIGLDNLDSIGGDFYVSSCNSLINLNGLQSLSFVGGGLGLWYNKDLTNIDSLENLNYIGDYLIIGGQESLNDLNGLGKIDSVGDLTIYQNNRLKNLIGLGKLSYVGGNFKLDYNDSLINLSGLDSLTYIAGNVKILNNYHIESLNGLENLIYVGGHMDIGTSFGGQLYFKSLSGLENLTTVGGYLTIANNDSLKTINNLKSLISIGSSFIISNNYSLLSIDSLWNLVSIGGTLSIGHNYLLQNINSLANIDANSISTLYIYENTLLSECDIESICDYISIPEAYTAIRDNAPGCNSKEEIRYACLVGISPKSVLDSQIIIYPNPTKGKFKFTSTDLLIFEMNIYNRFGQKVLSESYSQNTVDISSFKPGLYIVEFVTSKNRFKQKLTIK